MKNFKTTVLNLRGLGLLAFSVLSFAVTAGKPAQASTTSLAVTFLVNARQLRYNITVHLTDGTSKWKQTTLHASGANYLTWTYSEYDDATNTYISGIGDHDDVALLPSPSDTQTLIDGQYSL